MLSMSYVVSEIFGSKKLVILKFPGTERKRKSAWVQDCKVQFPSASPLQMEFSHCDHQTYVLFDNSKTKDNKISVSCLKD